ncbi:MAG: type II toxin-antitoxin system HipA family toxin [bacterium]|nr:type II toxin-antitoxin system HipA family toxin [bacterium]
MPRRHTDVVTAHLHGFPVGHLWTSQGTHRFELSNEYRNAPRRPVLGQVFEERPRHRWKQAQRLPEWFSNLLHEHSRLRQLVAEGYGINHRNEFRLLTALGNDLPGALQVVPDNNTESIERHGNGKTSSGGTDGLPGDQDESAGKREAYPIRFSLAGVQMKLSMMRSANTLTLPGKGVLGDHLVKLPSRQYDNLIENECSMMTWARETGIDVPDCEVRQAGDLGPLPRGFGALEGTTVYVVRRFDRGPCGSIHDERIHMEDLNQVVDNWPEAKYEGASYERLGRIILVLCGQEDFLEYIRRLTFCIGIGNEDAHLKNWTIWYPNRIQSRLAPAYDLVSTIQYVELDRGMALKLGRTRDASRVDLPMMEQIARRTDVDPARVKQTVRQTLESMRDSWPKIISDLPVGKSFEGRLREYQRSVPLVRPYAL